MSRVFGEKAGVFVCKFLHMRILECIYFLPSCSFLTTYLPMSEYGHVHSAVLKGIFPRRAPIMFCSIFHIDK